MTSDKSYAVEQRLNALVNRVALSPLNKAISSTTFANLDAVSLACASGVTYLVKGFFVLTAGGNWGVPPDFRLTGPAVSYVDVFMRGEQCNTQTPVLASTQYASAAGTAGGGYNAGNMQGANLTGLNAVFTAEFRIKITTTAGGTLQLQAATDTANTNTWTCNYGEMELWQF